MIDETKNLIEFLNTIKSNQEDCNKIAMINSIVNFRNAVDIVNGKPFLNEIVKDKEIEKHLKYRQPQENYNIFGIRITEEESFIQDCNAVIVAISKSILEDKVKDEFKSKLSPNFQRLIDVVDFYKNIL